MGERVEREEREERGERERGVKFEYGVIPAK